jgi:hypothetical protein
MARRTSQGHVRSSRYRMDGSGAASRVGSPRTPRRQSDPHTVVRGGSARCFRRPSWSRRPLRRDWHAPRGGVRTAPLRRTLRARGPPTSGGGSTRACSRLLPLGWSDDIHEPSRNTAQRFCVGDCRERLTRAGLAAGRRSHRRTTSRARVRQSSSPSPCAACGASCVATPCRVRSPAARSTSRPRSSTDAASAPEGSHADPSALEPQRAALSRLQLDMHVCRRFESFRGQSQGEDAASVGHALRPAPTRARGIPATSIQAGR